MKILKIRQKQNKKYKNKNTVIEFVRNGRTFSESNTCKTGRRLIKNVHEQILSTL